MVGAGSDRRSVCSVLLILVECTVLVGMKLTVIEDATPLSVGESWVQVWHKAGWGGIRSSK